MTREELWGGEIIEALQDLCNDQCYSTCSYLLRRVWRLKRLLDWRFGERKGLFYCISLVEVVMLCDNNG